MVYEEREFKIDSSQKKSFDFRPTPPGTYFLEIRSSDRIPLVMKVIVIWFTTDFKGLSFRKFEYKKPSSMGGFLFIKIFNLCLGI